jgi:lipocalin
MINKSVVKTLDIQKYLGTWYEIARYDHRFERGLVGVTANYSIREDGKIKVINQ